MSLCRQNFHDNCESGLNVQINSELTASYAYLSMAAYFDRDSVALPGFAEWAKKASDEENAHAQLLIDYQNKRGGQVVFTPISSPKNEWKSALEALEDALVIEKNGTKKLLDLHKIAAEHGDPQLTDFLEGGLISHHVDAEKKLADWITQIKRCGEGLGVWLFDKELSH